MNTQLGTEVIDAFAESREPRMFLSPSRVIAGDQASHRLGSIAAELGWPGGRILVVVVHAIGELGLAAPALRSLESSGFSPVQGEAVRAEPSTADARAMLAFARRTGPVAVLGVGGGSAIDLAKFVALALADDSDIADFYGAPAARRRAKLIAIPTTTGTGAEVTRIAMLSEAGRKIIVSSPELVPDLVVLDGAMVARLPSTVLAATGLDALCHAVESMLSTNRSALSLANSLAALKLISKWLPRGYRSPDDVQARRALLYAAHFAGLGLNAGVVLGHSIGYTIASRTSLAHGVTCAMALPACLAYARPVGDRMLQLIAAETIGRPDPDALVEWVIELTAGMGVPPSLTAAGIPASAVAEMARECIEQYPRANNPIPLKYEPVRDLYEKLAAGRRN